MNAYLRRRRRGRTGRDFQTSCVFAWPARINKSAMLTAVRTDV
jgi:hypothetical protein